MVSGSLRAHHKESCAETSSNPGEFIYEIGILVRLFPLTLSGVNSQPCALTHSFPKFHRMGKRSNEGSWPSSAGAGLEASRPSKGPPPACAPSDSVDMREQGLGVAASRLQSPWKPTECAGAASAPCSLRAETVQCGLAFCQCRRGCT